MEKKKEVILRRIYTGHLTDDEIKKLCKRMLKQGYHDLPVEDGVVYFINEDYTIYL